MKRIVAALLIAFFYLSSSADESIGLEFPVEDAKTALHQSNFEFAAIEYADGLDFPGLDAHQTEIVKERYQVRLLNHRWQSFTNIEERQEELERMKAYALRYNLTMWQGVKQQQIRDFKRYRY